MRDVFGVVTLGGLALMVLPISGSIAGAASAISAVSPPIATQLYLFGENDITETSALVNNYGLQFDAILTDPDGNGVGGQTVVFSISGSPVCEVVTDSTGYAQCFAPSSEIIPLMLAGTFTGSVAGSPGYRPSSTTESVTLSGSLPDELVADLAEISGGIL
jgi:hypothetical protein